MRLFGGAISAATAAWTAKDAAACDKQWAVLWQRFMPGVDYRDEPEWITSRWQNQPHIFGSPFYYIEYGMAQLGAALGREFPYTLLQAVAPWDEATVQRGLHQLVEAELLYQRGLPPQATYVFKHALIQDAAYQSLLKSTRQQYH